MPKVKQINHVAVVVEDMEKALSFWRDALGMELHGLRDVPAEKSQVAFLPLPGSEVELVTPTTDDSGIAKYLANADPECTMSVSRWTISMDDGAVEGKRRAPHQRRTAHCRGWEEVRLRSPRKHLGSTGGVVSDITSSHLHPP